MHAAACRPSAGRSGDQQADQIRACRREAELEPLLQAFPEWQASLQPGRDSADGTSGHRARRR